MRLRALPQSFWQQPNVTQQVSPATMFPVLPPLCNKDTEEDSAGNQTWAIERTLRECEGAAAVSDRHLPQYRGRHVSTDSRGVLVAHTHTLSP